MKKLEKSYSSTNIEGTRLHRDDVELIIELIKQELGSPTLSDNNFEYSYSYK